MRKRNTYKVIAVVASAIALVATVYAINEHKAANMISYAAQHNCEWHYDYYINKEPVCR